jgi:hypothetical protein
MTREKDMFTSFKENDCSSDTIMFGDNSEGRVHGYGKIVITTDHSISKVLLVDSLNYNLLSVSQLYEMGYNYLFTNKGVTVFRRCDGSYAFSGILKGGVPGAVADLIKLVIHQELAVRPGHVASRPSCMASTNSRPRVPFHRLLESITAKETHGRLQSGAG